MSGRQQVIIHAGLPKTATTYLQHCFAANRDWLRDRGVWYPVLGQEHLTGHHNLARRLRGLPTVGADYGEVTNDELLERVLATDAPQVLLSSEEFAFVEGEAKAALQRALAGREPQFVVFLRRRSQMCVSSWQEAVKHGSDLGLLEYIATELLGASARVLRFEQVLEPIHAAFGAVAMRVAIYDHLVEDGLDPFDFFVSSVLGLEVDASIAGRGEHRNPALTPAVLEIVRAINAARIARGDQPSTAQLASVLRFLKTADGQQVLADVVAVIERCAEDIDLRALDGEWRDRDRVVRAALEEQVLNAADEQNLFRRQDQPVVVRQLRPSRLYSAIAPSVFAAFAERLDR